jgi:hypothetical protein
MTTSLNPGFGYWWLVSSNASPVLWKPAPHVEDVFWTLLLPCAGLFLILYLLVENCVDKRKQKKEA